VLAPSGAEHTCVAANNNDINHGVPQIFLGNVPVTAIADSVKSATVFDFDRREFIPALKILLVLGDFRWVELAQLLCFYSYQMHWYDQHFHVASVLRLFGDIIISSLVHSVKSKFMPMSWKRRKRIVYNT
jgi:hypothetical protein